MKITLPFTLAIALLFGSCATETNIYYDLDPRYSGLVPDYSKTGISFAGDNGDTLRYRNFTDEYNYVYASVSISGKQLVTQELRRVYKSPNSNLDMRFTIGSMPDQKLEYAAFTNYEFSIQFSQNLLFTQTDTTSFGNMQFIGEYTVDGITYDDVYADPNTTYFSLSAGYLKFKLGNNTWYTRFEE